jgi:hypothetical protein
VTAAADGRTFVVAAESFPMPTLHFSTALVAWYLLRIGPGVKEPTLTKLSTGKALRTWTQQTNGFPAGYGWGWDRYINSSITWLADGRTLAFADGTYSRENAIPLIFSDEKIRTIDLASPSGDLLAESKVVFSSVNHGCDTLQLTADGKTVVCGTFGGGAKKSAAYDPEILEYSVRRASPASCTGSHLAITSVQFTGLITKGTRTPINLDPALVPPCSTARSPSEAGLLGRLVLGSGLERLLVGADLPE